VLYLIYPSSVFDLGNAGDYLGYHNGGRFSTKDWDNDEASNVHCASHPEVLGAWWHRSCRISNLNGVHPNQDSPGTMLWHFHIKRSEMKIRPVDLFKPMD